MVELGWELCGHWGTEHVLVTLYSVHGLSRLILKKERKISLKVT